MGRESEQKRQQAALQGKRSLLCGHFCSPSVGVVFPTHWAGLGTGDLSVAISLPAWVDT
jgi:hypothetical protein